MAPVEMDVLRVPDVPELEGDAPKSRKKRPFSHKRETVENILLFVCYFSHM
jgi:hypothetical protein